MCLHSKKTVVAVLGKTSLHPLPMRQASCTHDNDVNNDDKSDAPKESSEDDNDPMYDDMLRELEVVEEENRKLSRDEEGEDDTPVRDNVKPSVTRAQYSQARRTRRTVMHTMHR